MSSDPVSARVKKKRNDEDDALMALDKSVLVSRIKELKANVRRLSRSASSAQRKSGRPFDFSRFCMRQIALKVAYIGWDYHGFASQENTDNTVEEHLLRALTKSCLIHNREEAFYSRCGRTDKGVSAYCQVISVRVRSQRLKKDEVANETDEDWKQEADNELDYVQLLNKILPKKICVLAWSPVRDDFNARFDCTSRMYKYFLPSSDLDIETMHAAAQDFVGEHDFRNYCKVDVGNNVNHFMRRILSFDIKRSECQNSASMCEFTICGTAFLWHQIRCMVALLVLVGAKLEERTVVKDLLNIEKYPKRPQYNMASEIPLVLFQCEFPGIEWVCSDESATHNYMNFQNMLSDLRVRSAMVERMSVDLSKRHCESLASEQRLVTDNEVLPFIPGCKRAHYKAMCNRHVCEGLERYLAKQTIKREKMKRKYADMESKEEQKVQENDLSAVST